MKRLRAGLAGFYGLSCTQATHYSRGLAAAPIRDGEGKRGWIYGLGTRSTEGTNGQVSEEHSCRGAPAMPLWERPQPLKEIMESLQESNVSADVWIDFVRF